MPNNDELSKALARIAELEAANAAHVEKQRKQASARLSIRVSSKGGVSVYGLQRWPVTLYAEQWARLAAYMGEVQEFCKINADRLAVKPTGTIAAMQVEAAD